METCLWLNYTAATSLLRSKQSNSWKNNSRNGKFLEEYQNAQFLPISLFSSHLFLQHRDKHRHKCTREKLCLGLPIQDSTSTSSVTVASQHSEGRPRSMSHYSGRQLRLGAGTPAVGSQSVQLIYRAQDMFLRLQRRIHCRNKCKSVPIQLKGLSS